jgi:hypothetical protein
MSTTKLTTLSNEELIKELQHPEYPSKIKHAEFIRALCLAERVAQGKNLANADLTPEAKKEAIFAYHPDSRLFCVHGKNRIGLDGVLESEEDEIKHREMWCKYNPCKPVANTAAHSMGNVVAKTEPVVKTTAYSIGDGVTMMSSLCSSCSCLLMIIGLASMFRS